MNQSGTGPKVAIAKSRIYKGGVFQVLEGIIQLLNEEDIIPDLVTMHSFIQQKDVEEAYGQSVKMRIREILINPKMPYEWHFLFFNFFARKVLREYDIVISSSNTSFLSGRNGRRMTYVHYPRRDRVMSSLKSLHFPDGPRKSFMDIGSDPFRLARLLYSFDRKSHQGERVIANSEYTKGAILKNYNLSEEDIKVIYPPVDVPSTMTPSNPKMHCISSLGRFSEDKRQLEQIKIAEQLPDFQFNIMGFVENPAYFEKCQRYVSDNRLSNVKLLANAPFEMVQELLTESAFFIHSVRAEPFGITTVQGIARGALPIVHDSGGQREVVPNNKLRYSSVEDAVQKIRQYRNINSSEFNILLAQLFAHCQRFSRNSFFKAMRPEIASLISES